MKNTISKQHIEKILENSNFTVVGPIYEKTTTVSCKLPNGFVITESASCVDPENYNREIGVDLCKKRIINKVWELEGYKLQCKLADNLDKQPTPAEDRWDKSFIVLIAKECHRNNREYCKLIGDDSKVEWDEAPVWEQESVCQGVLDILESPDVTPEQMHQKWFDFLRRDGWAHGKKKSLSQKTHPCLVPFNELPAAHQVKDEIFINTVKKFL